ncbi:protein of unknown function [Carnobacterium iners]|uniref:DUF4867 domain-containing protein n=1 Tax=Carnobacterium iners TaxID=1073423 RepID=A0A1X7N1K9_9LACT|nr:DUF4867 family protein [Carnobacterium iners]SEK20309.1 protein of unknown function [Carnobacterium iners]SMH30252.1 protein of unknown function [Carnobacterium iners]
MKKIDAIRKENQTYTIYDVTSPEFKAYGAILEGYDIAGIKEYAEKAIDVPKEGNSYSPSNSELETFKIIKEIKADIYAGLPIEAGECAGNNTSFSAYEYHQGSEVNIVLTDVLMVLGKREQAVDGVFNAQKDAKVFYVPAGTIIEMYGATLHYSPCIVDESGFKVIVILIKGSNEPFEGEFETKNKEIVKTNKFQLVHETRKDKIAEGVKIGLVGELIVLKPVH